MGQGIHTALAMMAAEEMDADWSLVQFKEAPALDESANGYLARADDRRCGAAHARTRVRLRHVSTDTRLWAASDRWVDVSPRGRVNSE
jgi:CO/xanthine dehydrogenase Mo-binding subunit